MANVRPGNQERGWNDPPFFDYASVANVQSSPRRTLLNKRVAYPANISRPSPHNSISGSADKDNPLPSTLLVPGAASNHEDAKQPDHVPTVNMSAPPPQPDLKIFVPEQDRLQQTVNDPTVFQDTDKTLPVEKVCEKYDLKNSCDKLLFVLKSFSESLDFCQNNFQNRALEEIRRKIDIFEGKWKENKLSDAVQEKMVLLAAALKDENYEEAHSIHVSLMVDHTSEVNVWLVGIKRVVGTLRQKHSSRQDLHTNSNTDNSQTLDKEVKMENVLDSEITPATPDIKEENIQENCLLNDENSENLEQKPVIMYSDESESNETDLDHFPKSDEVKGK